MRNIQNSVVLITIPYWLGVAADALWAVGLLIPKVFAILTGTSEFNPDLQTRLIMGIGGSFLSIQHYYLWNYLTF